MSFLTLFSAPKPFTDPRIAVLQGNAIESWRRLPDVEVLLMGNEQGIAPVTQRAGLRHLPHVDCNASGTPLISSMMQLARENSQSALLAIINADMILMADFVEAAEQVMRIRREFVLLGRRWDMDISEPMGFTADWEMALRAKVEKVGALHRPAGSDYFVFPRACYRALPDFAVGRAGWDNWMIYEARRQHWDVIDGTESIMAVHQNHDYSHLPGGEPHYAIPESDENIRLAGGEAPIRYTILDATRCLRDGRLVRPGFSYLRFMRALELFLRAVFFFLPPAMIEEVARPKRWKRRFFRLLGRG
jgi:hypothetical protein